MEEKELIKGCVAGDKRCWDIFARRYSRLIYDSAIRTCRQIGLKNRAELIQDIHNDVFVELLKNDRRAIKDFGARGGCTLASYIRAITSNRTIVYKRKSLPYAREVNEESWYGAAINLKNSICADETRDKISRVLSALDEKELGFLLRCFFSGSKASELAQRLKISRNNFYVRKNRIIAKLRLVAGKLRE